MLLYNGGKTTGGYIVTVQFAPIECQTFTINSLSMTNQNFRDYEDST